MYNVGDTAWCVVRDKNVSDIRKSIKIIKSEVVSVSKEGDLVAYRVEFCDTGYRYWITGDHIFRTRDDARIARKKVIASKIAEDIKITKTIIDDMSGTVKSFGDVMTNLKEEYKKLTGEDFKDTHLSKKVKRDLKRKKHDEKIDRKDRKFRRVMKGMAMVVLCGTLFGFTGCQSADPASRSNATEYGDLVSDVTVRDKSSLVVNITVGDGLYASADGGGDTNSTTPTQTTDTSPSASIAWAGGAAGMGDGETKADAVNGLEKILDKLNGKQNVAPLTKKEADAVRGCIGGDCSEGCQECE